MKNVGFDFRCMDFIPLPISADKSSPFDQITASPMKVDFGLSGSGLVGSPGTLILASVLAMDRLLFCTSTTSVDRGR